MVTFGHIELPWPALAARRAALREAYDQAITEWEALSPDPCDAVSAALLQLHRPKEGDEYAECDHCYGGHPHDGMLHEPWPCKTYTTIRDNLNGDLQ